MMFSNGGRIASKSSKMTNLYSAHTTAGDAF